MALLTSEIIRIRSELGYNVLLAGAEPYIGVTAVFNQVIQAYTQGGTITTSSTPVTAASAPTQVTLTLASIASISVGDRLIIDIDSAQEEATIESISGSTVTIYLSKAHLGTYPVTVEGGETIIREVLRQLYAFSAPGGLLETAGKRAGIKKADEVEFFGATNPGARSTVDELTKLRDYWRDELAAILNVPNMQRVLRGGSSFYEAY